MLVIRSLLVIIYIFTIAFFSGYSVCAIKKTQYTLSRIIIYGFVYMISFFELIAFPFIIIGKNFHILCYLFLGFSIIIVIVGICLYRNTKDTVLCIEKDFSWMKMLFFALVIAQIFLSVYKHIDSWDDGYYVAISNIAVEKDLLELNDYSVYGGNHLFDYVYSRPGIASWEIFIAFLSKIFCIHPTILAHNFLPIVIIPLYYMAAREVINKLTLEKKNIYSCMIVYLLINSFLVKEAFVVPWIGKEFLHYIVMPLLLANGLEIVSGDKKDFMPWLNIGFVSIAAVASTANGIYTVPLYCLTMGVPYVCYLFIKKDYEEVRRICVSALLSMSFIIIIGIYAVLCMQGFMDTENLFDFQAVDWLGRFANAKVIYISFLGSLFAFGIGSYSKKYKILIYGQVLMTLLYTVPFLGKYIAKYITGMVVYGRIALYLPVAFLVSVMLVDVMSKTRIYNTSVVVFCILGIVFSNKSFYGNLSAHQNIYKIDDKTLKLSMQFQERINAKEEIVILAKMPYSKLFRQYSSYFNVGIGRIDLYLYQMEGLTESYLEMYNSVFVEETINPNTEKLLDYFNVEYIVSTSQLNDSGKFSISDTYSQEGFYIYER